MGDVHRFFDHYRTWGLALCLSLATYAASESWWLYGHTSKLDVASCQYMLGLLLHISAALIFFLSFAVQFLHYQGAMWRARAWGGFKEYSLPSDSMDAAQKDSSETQKKYINDSNNLHYWGDRVVNAVAIIALVNFLLLIIYVACYHPPGGWRP